MTDVSLLRSSSSASENNIHSKNDIICSMPDLQRPRALFDICGAGFGVPVLCLWFPILPFIFHRFPSIGVLMDSDAGKCGELLNLPSLELRRLAYNIISGYIDMCSGDFFELTSTKTTRGHLYIIIKIGLSRCVSTGVAWMYGRSDDVRRPAAGAGEGRGGGTVRGLRGTRVQAGRTGGQTWKPTAQIEPKSRYTKERVPSGLCYGTGR